MDIYTYRVPFYTIAIDQDRNFMLNSSNHKTPTEQFLSLNEAIISVVSPPNITNEEYIDILEDTLIMIAEEEEEFCEDFTCYLPESVSDEETDEEYIEMLESVICDIAFENDCDAEDLLEITNRKKSLSKISSASQGEVKKNTEKAAMLRTKRTPYMGNMVAHVVANTPIEQRIDHAEGKKKEAKAKIARAENLKKTTGRKRTSAERATATKLRQAHHKERAKGTLRLHNMGGTPTDAEYNSNVRWTKGRKHRLDSSQEEREAKQKKAASKSPKSDPKYHGDLEESKYNAILDKIDARSKRREDVFNRMAKPGNYGRGVARDAAGTEETKQKRVAAVRAVAATKRNTPERKNAASKATKLRKQHQAERDTTTFLRHAAGSDNPARKEAKTPGEKKSVRRGADGNPVPKFGTGRE